MCIIILQPKDHVFSDEAILDFYERNPHGFGFMWVDEKGLQSVRIVPRDGQEAIEAYLEHAAGREGVIHFRYATSGPVNPSMAHPFPVRDDLLVVHNGVLPGGSERESDTAQFVREVLQPLLKDGRDVLEDPEVADYIEDCVVGSSLVFLDADNVVTKFGREGVEYDGCWYSNTYAWTLPPELGGPGLDGVDWLEEDDELLFGADDLYEYFEKSKKRER